jgi:hypothetical protein
MQDLVAHKTSIVKHRMIHKLAILLSDRGSNFLAIANSISTGTIPYAGIAIVISNR